MSAEPLPPTREYRKHPLLNRFVVAMDDDGVAFAGEIVDIIRTSARYGDAPLIKEFTRADGKPIAHRMVSISDMASLSGPGQVLLFERPVEALDFMAAHCTDQVSFYIFDDHAPPG